MDHALDPMGDGGGVRGEEAGIEAPHTARRGERARDQEQSGRIGQEAGIGKRLPRAFELWRGGNGGGTVDQDQGCCILGSVVGMVIGLFLFALFRCCGFDGFGHSIPAYACSSWIAYPGAISSGALSSNPCMRSAHCTPTTAPFT